MDDASFRRMRWIVAFVAGVILYGSLYPFQFAYHPLGPALEGEFLASWHTVPRRGDILANLVLYMPLGFCLVLSARSDRLGRTLAFATAAGLSLSMAVELAQMYDEARFSSLYDVLLNGLGTLIGAMGGWAIRGYTFRGLAIRGPLDPFALLLVGFWVGYRLFPFVPTLDFQKIKDALKPLLLQPVVLPLGVLRHTVAWLVVFALLRAAFGPSGAVVRVALLMAIVLVGKVLVLTQSVTMTEVVGMALSLPLWWFLFRRSDRPYPVLAALLFAVIVVEGLRPFMFLPVAGTFHLTPLYGFLAGSMAAGVVNLFAKCFLYGAAIWLLRQSGWSLTWAAVATACLLLAIEVTQTLLPGRLAEVTDPILVIALALLMHALPEKAEAQGRAVHRDV